MEAIETIAKNWQTTAFKKFRSNCQTYAENVCNGGMSEEYEAKRAKYLEVRAGKLLGLDYIPVWLQLYGDPRGFVAYIDGDCLKHTLGGAEMADLLEKAGVPKDWGGNYSIAEIK